LNDIQFNENLYSNLKTQQFINNNRQNIGIYTTLSGGIEYDLHSEKLEQIQLGDILLYKNQLIIASKNIKNINTHYIKLGNIQDFEELSTILNSLSAKKYVISFTALEIDHNIVS
jgi:hypothetical protein